MTPYNSAPRGRDSFRAHRRPPGRPVAPVEADDLLTELRPGQSALIVNVGKDGPTPGQLYQYGTATYVVELAGDSTRVLTRDEARAVALLNALRAGSPTTGGNDEQ